MGGAAKNNSRKVAVKLEIALPCATNKTEEQALLSALIYIILLVLNIFFIIMEPHYNQQLG